MAIRIFSLFNHQDGTIAQSESLGSILRCVEIDLEYGDKITDMTLYGSNGPDNSIAHVTNNGTILDVGYQLAMYHIFISVIRKTANEKNCNTKETLKYLRQIFQRYYK